MQADTVKVDKLNIRSDAPISAAEVTGQFERLQGLSDNRWIFIRSITIASSLNGLGAGFSERVQSVVANAIWGGSPGAADAEAIWFRDELEWRSHASRHIFQSQNISLPWFCGGIAANTHSTPPKALISFWSETPRMIAAIIGKAFSHAQLASLWTLLDETDFIDLYHHLTAALGVNAINWTPPPSPPQLLNSVSTQVLADPLAVVLSTYDAPISNQTSYGAKLAAVLLTQRWHPDLFSQAVTPLHEAPMNTYPAVAAFCNQVITHPSFASKPLRVSPVSDPPVAAEADTGIRTGNATLDETADLSGKPARRNTQTPADILARAENQYAGTEIEDRRQNLHDQRLPARSTDGQFSSDYAGIFFVFSALCHKPFALLCHEHNTWHVLGGLLVHAIGSEKEALQSELPLIEFLSNRAGYKDPQAYVREVVAAPGLAVQKVHAALPADSLLRKPQTLNRRGHIRYNETNLDIDFPLAETNLDVRLAGIDVDPNWVPSVNLVIKYHYTDRNPW